MIKYYMNMELFEKYIVFYWNKVKKKIEFLEFIFFKVKKI